MKNKKTLIAAIVVAAIAVISVVGVIIWKSQPQEWLLPFLLCLTH